MSAVDRKIGRHWRIPWRSDEPGEIVVHSRLEGLKGTNLPKGERRDARTALYDAAKFQNDHDAAVKIVKELVSDEIIERIVDALIKCERPCRIVFPHPEFDSDSGTNEFFNVTNALPFALATYMATTFGATIETEIVETARPGRTKLDRFERFLWQPCFTGSVDTGCAYIIVDDVCTLGGTLAMLRTHIVGNGGTLIAVCALSASEGVSCKFGIADATVSVLKRSYGGEISPLWIEEIGHDITCLTESEGRFVASWGKERVGRSSSLLQQLRDRLDKAKTTGKL